MNNCYVGVVHNPNGVFLLQEKLYMEGYYTLKINREIAFGSLPNHAQGIRSRLGSKAVSSYGLLARTSELCKFCQRHLERSECRRMARLRSEGEIEDAKSGTERLE